jgi:hypothetical protein
VGQAIPLDTLVAGTQVVPLARVLEHLPALTLTDQEIAGVRHGRPVPAPPDGASRGGPHVALMRDESVVAIAVAEGDSLKPVVVLESA